MKGRLLIILLIALCFTAAGFLVLQKELANIAIIDLSAFHKSGLHLAGESAVSINKVTGKVVYFTPNDLSEKTAWPWQDKLTETLDSESTFFEEQLGSRIEFSVYPEVLVGKNDHRYYDGEDTNGGNPNALLSVREEILARIFDTGGDKYSAIFSTPTGNYEFLLIIYEGTGASAMIYQNGPGEGTDVVKVSKDGLPAIILSSAFLNSPFYAEFGPTILAHEIAHSFGLSDAYDKKTGAELSSDLMGEGRRRVLTATYLSEENKKLLGAE